MNILITCIGAMSENAPSVLYNKGTIEAEMTSEACCKYLLKKRGRTPDLVIALCMPDGNKTKNNYISFERSVSDFCTSEGRRAPSFAAVKITKNEEKANFFGRSIFMVRHLIQQNSKPEGTRIMIDTSPKLHSLDRMFQMVICLLKHDGYNMIESYYTSPEKKQIAGDHTDHLMAMTEAITEFSEYGTSEKTRACFKSFARKKTDPIVNHLMKAMQSFSDSIQLCQTERLQDILNNEVFPTLDEIDKMSESAVIREDIFTLKLMAENIRKKFGFSMTGDKYAVSPMMLIEWCLKNRCIQQAVTLFVESIPKYLFSSGIVEYDDMLDNTLNSPEVNFIYTQMLQACCTENGVTYVSSNNGGTRLMRLELMKKYIEKGRVNEADEDKIRLFIDTLDEFRRLIGDRRPRAVMGNYPPKNEAEKKLVELILKFNPTSFSKFVNTLKVHTSIFTLFLNEMDKTEIKPSETETVTTEANIISKKLFGIRNFTMQALRRNLPGIRLNIHRDKIGDFKKFLAYYVYIKQCVRNYLNHARDFEDDLSTDQIEEFQSYSINTEAHSISTITDNIIDAMKCLDSCIIKEHKSIRPVKKYYLNIPKSSVTDTENVRSAENKIVFHNSDPQISGFGQTHFSIIPVIANSVRAGEMVKIYGIKPASEYSDIWEAKLFAELDELVIEKDFDYEYEQIDNSEANDISTPLGLFSRLVSTVVNGDSIYADLTSVEAPIPMIMMMFMNYLINYQKDTKIESAVYGRTDNSSLICELYDITNLIYAGNIISNANNIADAKNPLEAIMSYGNQPKEQKTSCAEGGIAEDNDSADTGKNQKLSAKKRFTSSPRLRRENIRYHLSRQICHYFSKRAVSM